jgi:aldehyde:ferredoxin oxidoreductase
MTSLHAGAILWVDLTTGAVRRTPTEQYAQRFLGGRAVDARLIYDLVPPGTDPLGPDNVIVFGTGPLSGTPFPGCSRLDVMALSPVTGLLGNANIGGDWGAELKYAGYDHLVLTGRSSKPVYLSVRNQTVELRDATRLLGAATSETRRAIAVELDSPDVKVLCIGPAGENLVTYASIHSNVGNAAARTGMGAVLGSKNVKALAVRGTGGVAIADRDAFLTACLDAHTFIRSHPDYEETHERGVMDGEYAFVRSGGEASGDGHEGIAFDPEGKTDFLAFWKRYGHKRTGCMGCPVHCMENYHVPGVGGAVISCEMYPQLSWEVRNSDMRLWFELVRFSQEQGVDNTSAAILIQWVMELFEKGIVGEKLLDGIVPVWGDRDALWGLLTKIVAREGIGDVLAQGLKAAAEHFDALVPAERRGGRSTYELAMQVNNNPMYGITDRVSSLALGYAVGRRSDLIQDIDIPQFNIISTPAHEEWTESEKQSAIEFETRRVVALTGEERAGDGEALEGKAMIVHDMGIATGISDIAGSCKWHTKWFLDLSPEHYAAALTAGLGREVTTDELRAVSLRMRSVERAYECRLGRRRENDTIPRKEFGKPISRGTAKGRYGVTEAQLEQLKDEYYTLRGWDLATGVPTRATLLDQGLDDVARDLAAAGILPTSGDDGHAPVVRSR